MTKRTVPLLIFVWILAFWPPTTPAVAQEKATLVTAEKSDIGTTEWRIALLYFSRYESRIIIGLRGHDGTNWTQHTKTVEYTGTTAVNLMKALNTANLSTAGNSLNSRILARLKTEGHLAATATISTTPEP